MYHFPVSGTSSESSSCLPAATLEQVQEGVGRESGTLGSVVQGTSWWSQVFRDLCPKVANYIPV